MADFEHVGTQIDTFRQESLLRRHTCVAGEEHAELLVLQDKRNRIVINCVLAADEGQRRTDERQCHAVGRSPHVTRARIDDWYVIRARRIETIVIRMSAVRLSAVGDLGDAQFAQYRSAPRDVIS